MCKKHESFGLIKYDEMNKCTNDEIKSIIFRHKMTFKSCYESFIANDIETMNLVIHQDNDTEFLFIQLHKSSTDNRNITIKKLVMDEYYIINATDYIIGNDVICSVIQPQYAYRVIEAIKEGTL